VILVLGAAALDTRPEALHLSLLLPLKSLNPLLSALIHRRLHRGRVLAQQLVHLGKVGFSVREGTEGKPNIRTLRWHFCASGYLPERASFSCVLIRSSTAWEKGAQVQ
jgi:hypothetical protein